MSQTMRVIDVILSLGLFGASSFYYVRHVWQFFASTGTLEPVLVMTCVTLFFLRDTIESIKKAIS